ncbi:acyltransferase family protein [Sphingomonas sp. NFX23]|uniref:acyltransferase family protein n=1 Tax=Sphingomonas sp. NFX23 TaxID=2819532 RepID=UPI003CF2D3DC
MRLDYLDGWRGIAIIVVLLGHFAPGIPQAGALGVDLFFVLSGRLMAKILIRDRYPLSDFFVRRFSRVYPALFVLATVMLIFSIIGRALGKHYNSLITNIDYVSALTFWLNYKVAFIGEAGALSHIWSLCVEEHSYIILAFMAAVASRSEKVGGVAFLIAAAAVLNGFLLSQHGGTEHQIFWRTDVRLAPLFFSFAFYLASDRAKRVMSALCLPAFVIGCILPFTEFPMAIQVAATAVLLALSVNGLDGAADTIRRVLEHRPLRYIGIISYSLYLWQQPFFTMHERISSALLLPAVVVCALASYYLVENPARAYINEHWSKRRRAKVK